MDQALTAPMYSVRDLDITPSAGIWAPHFWHEATTLAHRIRESNDDKLPRETRLRAERTIFRDIEQMWFKWYNLDSVDRVTILRHSRVNPSNEHRAIAGVPELEAQVTSPHNVAVHSLRTIEAQLVFGRYWRGHAAAIVRCNHMKQEMIRNKVLDHIEYREILPTLERYALGPQRYVDHITLAFAKLRRRTVLGFGGVAFRKGIPWYIVRQIVEHVFA